MTSLFYCVTGYCTLETDADNSAKLLEICRRREIPYENFQCTEEGGISLRFTLACARRVRKLCDECGTPLTETGSGGLPILGRRLWRRPGLLAGGILGVILLVVAQHVVWDVRISGNTTLSDRAVEASLAACGLEVGTPLRGFCADVTANEVLLYDDRLAWLSINRKGTVAYVEVREAVKRPEAELDQPCDLVAAEGGIIERVELESGNVRVTAGQAVSKGDMLVSGLYDSTQQGIRFTTARAKVFARTTRIISVKIPLTYRYKVYEMDLFEESGGVDCEKNLIFFGKQIKFKKKTGNLTACCDIIENEKSCGIVDGVGFPVSVRTTWYLPYTVTESIRTYAEAEELAYFELSKAIAALPGGAELIRKEISVHHGTDALTLTCTLTAVEDIARTRVIEIEK